LCLTCHPKIGERLQKVNLHLPEGKKACVACHNPHDSNYKKLLVNRLPNLCWKCHTDTVRLYKDSKSKHQPNESGECMACHSPHSSDQTLLLADAPKALCGKCHERMVHVSHPMDEVKDPRTQLPLNCLTCHNPHGTPADKLLHLSQERALCIQCHNEQL
jgi:predicted CXXCH cytochrome family protein